MATAPVPSARTVHIAAAVTLLNVLVASGFSVTGLVAPGLILPPGAVTTDASFIFAWYAANRTLALTLVVLWLAARRSVPGLIVLGALAGLVQFADAGVGLYERDIGKTAGPLVLAALQLYAVVRLRREAPSR